MDNRNQPPIGFSRLARRISAWTTNSLFCALILVVGLGFGRQVIRWWHAPPARNAFQQSPSLLPDHSSADPQSVSFANLPWSLNRQTVVATRDTIRSAVVDSCAKCVSAAPCPRDPCGPAEAALLQSLTSSQPTVTETGQWAVYETVNVLPMAVGLRTLPHSAKAELAAKQRPCRIAAWCVAISSERDLWTILCFSPCRTQLSPEGALSECPLPDDSRSLLSLRTSRAGYTQVFLGEGQLADWEAFFAQWFAQNGWKPSGNWQHRKGSWQGRYLNSDRTTPYLVDIRISTCDNDLLAGVLVASPAASLDTAENAR